MPSIIRSIPKTGYSLFPIIKINTNKSLFFRHIRMYSNVVMNNINLVYNFSTCLWIIMKFADNDEYTNIKLTESDSKTGSLLLTLIICKFIHSQTRNKIKIFLVSFIFHVAYNLCINNASFI